MSINNRIPSVVRDFSGRTETRNNLSFLSFEDWLLKNENEAKDWIVVARSWRDGSTDLFTFSTLASAKKSNLKALLSNSDWDINLEFGKPSFYSKGSHKTAYYDSGMSDYINGIKFQPFTIHRYFHGFIPNTFELVQNFILYHNAFFIAEKGEYHRIDDDGVIYPIIRVAHNNDNHSILVDTHHLRDYLAANQCYLVRYHDHRRWTSEDISQHIGGKFASYSLNSQTSCFELWLRTDIPMLPGHKSSSRLLGKDLVFPYSKPDESHTWFVAGQRKKDFVAFIIGRDKQGKDIESTCNEDALSNYFTDRGTPHFLTPVFFNRKVLLKYYNEPTRYKVTNSSVRCLDLWSLPIDITEEELVQVWLGDLGQIPYGEQLHWRQNNVAPRGTITRHRWLRDFMAEFAEPIDPIYHFRVGFEETQRETKASYGEELFLVLDDKDKYAYETLHLPLTDEWKEFDEQVQALAKVTVESLNVSLLSRESGRKIDRKEIKGSIDLLDVYLYGIGVTEDVRNQISTPLHVLQKIRSTGTAHRKGSDFHKAMKRFQLDNLSNRQKMGKLVTDLTVALSQIAYAIRNSKQP